MISTGQLYKSIKALVTLRLANKLKIFSNSSLFLATVSGEAGGTFDGAVLADLSEVDDPDLPFIEVVLFELPPFPLPLTLVLEPFPLAPFEPLPLPLELVFEAAFFGLPPFFFLPTLDIAKRDNRERRSRTCSRRSRIR